MFFIDVRFLKINERGRQPPKTLSPVHSCHEGRPGCSFLLWFHRRRDGSHCERFLASDPCQQAWLQWGRVAGTNSVQIVMHGCFCLRLGLVIRGVFKTNGTNFVHCFWSEIGLVLIATVNYFLILTFFAWYSASSIKVLLIIEAFDFIP